MSQAGVSTRCRNCGAILTWSPGDERLKCGSCGALTDVPADEAQAGPGEIVEYDLDAAFRHSKPRGRLGAGTREVKCNECGAEVEFPDGITATRCSFCDSPSVLAHEARADHYLPESLVPFLVDRDKAIGSFKSWLGGLWFRPGDLRSKASVSELRGVYIPYWTFDTQVLSRWTADAGYYYYVDEAYTELENGRHVTKHKRVQKTRWEPAHGQRHDTYDDYLVCASRGLPPELAKGVASFDTGALVVYAPQYLQGYSAESYQVELPEAWKRAQGEIASLQLGKCARDVPGDTHRHLRASHQYSSARFKHVLLPLWIAAFRYNGKVFRFLVNGQSGKVVGKAPWSVMKILLFVAVLIAAVVAAIFIFKR